MARYEMTEELSSLIRDTRKENRKSCDEIANAIGKSQAFISKIENGKIASIDEEVLLEIFEAIFGSEEKFNEFLNTTLKNVVVKRYMDEKELNNRLWFYNFDTVVRKLPISKEIVEDINSRIKKININYLILADRINANEDITDISAKSSMPKNLWYRTDGDLTNTFCIKMDIKPEFLKSILNGTTTHINYVTLYSIIYYLLKIENGVGPGTNEDLQEQTKKYLKQYKITMLSEKGSIKVTSNNSNEFSEYDNINNQLLDSIVHSLKFVSEIDIINANARLSTYEKNLAWDAPFMLTLASLDFSKLDVLTHEEKRKLLVDIKQLIEKYDNDPNLYNKIMYEVE